MNNETKTETTIVFATTRPIEMATEKNTTGTRNILLKSIRPLRSVTKVKSMRPSTMTSKKMETSKKNTIS